MHELTGGLTGTQAQNNSPSEPQAMSALAPYANWTELVAKVESRDPDGLEELYRIFSGGIRHYLRRQLGVQELDDKVHDSFLIVVQAIQRGELRDPQRLMGFVRTVVRRRVAAHIRLAIQQRDDCVVLGDGAEMPTRARNPEDAALQQQRAQIVGNILSEMSTCDHETLVRFYINEEPQGEICRAMGLSTTQFRLIKSRAKARFGELGRRRLASQRLSRLARAMAAAVLSSSSIHEN